MNNNLKMLAMCCGFAFFGVLSAQAQDKATLDLLVKKGLITQADEDSLAKAPGPVAATSKSATVQKLQIQGLLQYDYDDLTASDKGGNPNPPATNQQYLRRAMLGAVADLGNGWGANIMMDFAATQIADQPKSGLSPQAYPTTASTTGGQQGIQYISQNMFDKAIITKKSDDLNGTFRAGYDKTNFIQEELISTAELPAIERSVATRYFDEYFGSPTAYRLAFAQRRTGLFWDGNVAPVPGLYYSGALTNGVQSQINYTNVGGLDKIGAWVATGYKNKVDSMGLNYDFGINLGYSADGNSQNHIASSSTAGGTAQNAQSNSTYGYNPYLKISQGNWSLLAEFFQARFTNGRSNDPFTSTLQISPGVTSAASPYGINIIPVYKINDSLDIDARFSYLSTNGRGTDQNGILWNAPNDVSGSFSATTGLVAAGSYGPLFDNAMAIYLGFNYKISPGVRLSAGYEVADLTGRQTYVNTPGVAAGSSNGTSNFLGPRTEMGLVRVRLQVAF